MAVDKNLVKEGDYFTLSKEKGYSTRQRRDAMQVMECYDNVMTLICDGGCTTVSYDDVDFCEDLVGKNVFFYLGKMEDRR